MLMRGSDPVEGRVPISKDLISHEFSPNDRIRYIKKLLASREEQENAKLLETGDAVKFVELLDEVSLSCPRHHPTTQRLTGDQVLRTGGLDERTRPTCTRYLARVCGWHSTLPNSARISNHKRETENSGGGSSTVWVGRYDEQKVIIKVLNFYRSYDDIKKRELTKVSYYLTAGQQRWVDVWPQSRRSFARRR
jgi:hypothetical protein